MSRTEAKHEARVTPADPRSSLELALDLRERPSGLPQRLAGRWNPVVVRRLPVGGVEIGRILIERKEAHDFVSSLHSGRLFRQAYQLRSACARPLVLVEGDPYAVVDPSKSRILQGAILSLLTGFGIPVVRTRDLQGTVETLVRIARQESRRSLRRRSRRATKPAPSRARAESPAETNGVQLGLLSSLPGVGPLRSKALLDHLGSVNSLFSATWEDLRGVPGIGGATAARILVALAGGRARRQSGAGQAGGNSGVEGSHE